MKKHSVSILLLGWCVFMSCCQPAEVEAPPRIGLVLKSLDNPFFTSLQQGAEEAAAEAGVEVIVQAGDQETDVQQQVQAIEALIEMQVDALLVDPVGSGEVVPSILKANQAGIPVLILDTRIDPVISSEKGVSISAFVGSDNYQGGLVAAEFILEQTDGKANVAILEGIPGHETADSRKKGFLAALEGKEGVRVLASEPANWVQATGFNVAEKLLAEHPDLNVIFACNDLMALGAVEAIAAAGRSEDVKVVGFDAVEEARLAISDGSMLASVAQLPSEIGRIGVETAVQILSGKKVPEEIPVRIELITRENLYQVEW